MTTRKETPDVFSRLFAADPNAAPASVELRISSIRRDGGTQMRAETNKATVADYAMDMGREWGGFPPVIVYYDGTTYWLADGFHRIEAYLGCDGASDAHTIPADIRPGTRRDAILYAASANSDHGLRRTNADKRRAVDALLRDEEWRVWSDGDIAKRCEVSQPFVSAMRRELTQNGFESPTTRTGADGRTTNTANNGRKPAPAPKPSPEQRQHNAEVPAIPVPEAPAATMPADLAARGWELRQLGTGRYYANNRKDSKATNVFDSAADAVAAARSMQIDVRQPVSVEAITGGKLLVDLTDADWAAVADKEAFAYAKQRLYAAMAAMREAMVKLDGHHDELAAGIKVLIDDLGRMVGELE